jgi:queuosine precursor transporter
MNKQVSVTFMIFGMLFTVCLIVANIVGQKLITVGGIDVTAGLLIFPVTYIINDLIAEVWGYRKMRLIIWTGFLMNFLVVLIFRISIWAPASHNFMNQQAFELILRNTERITVASFIAFLFGSFLNAYVMSKMKILQHGRHFSVRAVASTIVGEGADSLVFFTIAFSGILNKHQLLFLILTQTALKTAYEIIALPLTNYIVKRVKKIENTNVFDNKVSYNPFKMKDI